MSQGEVPVGLFDRFLADATCPATQKPSDCRPDRGVSPTPDCPAQCVTWTGAALFYNWLSAREGRRPCFVRTGESQTITDPLTKAPVAMEVWKCDFDADGYRLPTEAEWEYACRAGAATAYSFGDDEDLLPVYAVFAKWQAAPAGSRMPSAWGLFDMHGNVREWCWDCFRDYTGDDAVDPVGPPLRTTRVFRGGSWYDLPRACRSADRHASSPTGGDSLTGFRVVCTVPGPPARKP